MGEGGKLNSIGKKGKL